MKFEIDKTLMKNSIGNYYTQGLFYEYRYTAGEDGFPVYSLRDYDFEFEGRTIYSLKQLYLEIADPTEYEVAMACFCGWKHWQRVRNNKMIAKHVDEWHDELEVKLRSQGLLGVIRSAQGEGSTGLAAAKYLSEKGWEPRAKRGRPSKDEVDRERRIAAGMESDVNSDLARIGLEVVRTVQ